MPFQNREIRGCGALWDRGCVENWSFALALGARAMQTTALSPLLKLIRALMD